MGFSQILPPAFYSKVHSDLRAKMAREGIDLLLLESNDDLIYTTGFSHYTTERPVIFALSQTEAWLLVPRLEETHARHQNVPAELLVYFEFPGVETPFDALVRLIGPQTGKRVAYSYGTSVARALAFKAAFSAAESVEPTGLVAQQRLVKYPEELVLHREAARLSDAMVQAGVDFICEAMRAERVLPTEMEIESHVSRHAAAQMRREHDDILMVLGLASGLVYSGKRSAFPHAMPTYSPLERGESVILSLGCRVGGRTAESERTFFLGEPTAAQEAHYALAFEAQAIATSGLYAGNSCAAADKAALDWVRAQGKGDYLLHRSGHGMGILFHEAPWVEEGDPTVLQEGMICSSEPSITVPDFAGYRIADTVLVTQSGPQSLTHFARRLDEIILT